MSAIKRIVITPGEPAGIGPDITLEIAQRSWEAELIVIANADLLLERAKIRGLRLRLIECNLDQAPTPHEAGTLKYINVPLAEKVIPGQLNAANAEYVIQTLKMAVTLCQTHEAHAIVTGPVHKEIINQAGIPFSGHTEFFAQACGVSHTVMLFVLPTLKVALLTTHLALKAVPQAITKDRLKTTLALLQKELTTRFELPSPRILVCGLNPHAGEGGYLGREEIDIITPVIEELKKDHQPISGPFPADTIFTPKYLAKADAILAMYHDQALPLVKYIGFGTAVNVTLGLPFIRTSVDHGTALDIVGTKEVDAKSLEAAIQLAVWLKK